MISCVPSVRTDADHLVLGIEADRDDSGRPWIRVGHEVRLFDDAFFGGEEDEAVLLELPDRQERGDLLVGAQRQEIYDRLAACRAAGLRYLVDFDPVDFADSG